MPSSSNPKVAPASCCKRFCSELKPCQDYFLVWEANGRTLDIPATFAPGTRCALWSKFLIWGVATGLLVYSWLNSPNKDFFLAYLTIWSLHFAWLYLTLSFLNTLLSSKTTQPTERVTGRVKLTWIMCAIAVHAQLFVTILFWTLLYNPGDNVKFLTAYQHGGLFLLVLIDALIINRIPLRFMHWYGFVLPFMLSYLAWSGIHAYLDLGNPNEYDNDPATNDDAIYPVLAWRDNLQGSLILSATIIFVFSPILYGMLRLVSMYHLPCFCSKDRLRYFDSYANHDVEAGFMFQTMPRTR
jgi:hypothetical protein